MLKLDKYHYLIAGLPELEFNTNSYKKTLLEYRNELRKELLPNDFELVKILMHEIDNKNLLNILAKHPERFLIGGNYSYEELKTNTLNNSNLATYLQDFFLLDPFQNFPEKPDYYTHELFNLYNEFTHKTKNSFLQLWFEFNINLRNIILILNNEKQDNGDVLLDKNKTKQIIEKYQSKNINQKLFFPWFEKLSEIIILSTPLSIELAIEKLRWDVVNNLLLFTYFSIDVILGYTIKLLINNRCLNLSESFGHTKFIQITKNLEEAFDKNGA